MFSLFLSLSFLSICFIIFFMCEDCVLTAVLDIHQASFIESFGDVTMAEPLRFGAQSRVSLKPMTSSASSSFEVVVSDVSSDGVLAYNGDETRPLAVLRIVSGFVQLQTDDVTLVGPSIATLTQASISVTTSVSGTVVLAVDRKAVGQAQTGALSATWSLGYLSTHERAANMCVSQVTVDGVNAIAHLGVAAAYAVDRCI